jgi:hypothetical protein
VSGFVTNQHPEQCLAYDEKVEFLPGILRCRTGAGLLAPGPANQPPVRSAGVGSILYQHCDGLKQKDAEVQPARVGRHHAMYWTSTLAALCQLVACFARDSLRSTCSYSCSPRKRHRYQERHLRHPKVPIISS